MQVMICFLKTHSLFSEQQIIFVTVPLSPGKLRPLEEWYLTQGRWN